MSDLERLKAALIEAINAAKKAEELSARLGCPLRFSSEDIREMAIAVFKRGGKRAA